MAPIGRPKRRGVGLFNSITLLKIAANSTSTRLFSRFSAQHWNCYGRALEAAES
jgi:hypothetical protein